MRWPPYATGWPGSCVGDAAIVATGKKLHNLELLREAVDDVGDTSSALADFSQHSSFLSKRLYACPNDAEDAPAEGNARIVETYQGPAHRFHIVLCLPEKGEALTTCFGCASAKPSMSPTGWEGTGLNGPNACPVRSGG